MIVFDTNVISEMMRPVPNPVVLHRISTLSAVSTALTAVTITEIAYGIERMSKGKKRNHLNELFFGLIKGMPILPLDERSAYKTAEFRVLRENKGLRVDTEDMMIAGIAAANNAVIATRNIKDFALLPIEIINPWQSN